MIKETAEILFGRWDFFLPLIYEHLEISAAAIIIATAAGLFLGVLISQYKILSPYVLGATNIIYTIPSIALFGFLIPFTGVGNLTAVAALTLYALLPMIRNTYTGIANIPPAVTEAAEGMGSGKIQLLFRIKLPLAMPVIISGLRNMAVMTVALAGIASFIGAGGLGVAIYRGITTNNAAMTLAGSVLIALMAFTADLLLGAAEKAIKKKKYLPLKIASAAAVFLFAALFFTAGDRDGVIKIASKPMTEQFIISEMLKMLIEENTGLKAEITKGIGGGTGNIHPAMLKGEFDMYPEYTGTAWKFVLKHSDNPPDEMMIKTIKEEYEDKFGFRWVSLYGFNNRFGLGVRKELAEKYGLKTYSDLAPYSPGLVFGAEYDFFERDDGYSALSSYYGYNFKSTADMDIGLKYSAVNSGKVDVINLFTTDAMIPVSDIRILEDDRNFFENYHIGTVVRKDTLEKHPELLKALELMDGLISDEEMAAMNYAVEAEKKSDRETAAEFLISKGLLKEAP